MQISGLFKAITPKLKTCGQNRSPFKFCLKPDEVIFSLNKALIENKLVQLEKTMKGFLDESVIKEGTELIREFLPHIDIDKMDDEAIQYLEKLKIEDVNSNLKKCRYFLSTLLLDKPDKAFMKSKTFKNFFKDFSADYKKKAPLEIFKANLMNISMPLITSTKEATRAVQEKAYELHSRLKFFGLSPEIIEQTKKMEEKFGTQIIPINDKQLMQRFEEELSIHKFCYDDMPNTLSLIEISLFNLPQLNKGKALYHKNLKNIYFNLNSTLIETIFKLTSLTMNRLKHELCHHLHNSNRSIPNYATLFSFNERLLLNRLNNAETKIKRTLNPCKRQKIKEILNIEIHDPNISKDVNNPTNIFRKIKGLNKYAEYLNITESEKKQIAELEKKLQKIQKLILAHYRPYALTHSNELVAEAFAHSNEITPSPQMQKILDYFKMPKLKDRSYLPEDHPVMKLIKEKVK